MPHQHGPHRIKEREPQSNAELRGDGQTTQELSLKESGFQQSTKGGIKLKKMSPIDRIRGAMVSGQNSSQVQS